jgi:hypothetical protein
VELRARCRTVEKRLRLQQRANPLSSAVESAASGIHFLRLAERLGTGLELWRLQNMFWELMNASPKTVDTTQDIMTELGNKLGFDELPVHDKIEEEGY